MHALYINLIIQRLSCTKPVLTVFLLHNHRHKTQLAETLYLFLWIDLLPIMAPCMWHQLGIGKVPAGLLQYLMGFGQRCQACDTSASAGSLTWKKATVSRNTYVSFIVVPLFT